MTAQEQQLRKSTSSKRKILLVDDDETLVEVEACVLEDAGYQVIFTSNSWHAFELFRAGPQEYDLVVSDFEMPYLNGLELARKIREIRHDIPIIFASGRYEAALDELDSLGVETYLKKPFELTEFLSTIQAKVPITENA